MYNCFKQNNSHITIIGTKTTLGIKRNRTTYICMQSIIWSVVERLTMEPAILPWGQYLIYYHLWWADNRCWVMIIEARVLQYRGWCSYKLVDSDINRSQCTSANNDDLSPSPSTMSWKRSYAKLQIVEIYQPIIDDLCYLLLPSPELKQVVSREMTTQLPGVLPPIAVERYSSSNSAVGPVR